jgi:transcriptional accessory protein Tex/SPT6
VKKKARTIVEYRKETGAFKNIEQLCEVNGIGAETVKRIKDLVFINEEKSSHAELQSAKEQRKNND